LLAAGVGARLVDVGPAGWAEDPAAPAGEPVGDGAADEAGGWLSVEVVAPELGANRAADLLDAVQPAVTRTGTSTSAAAIRRMPPSSPILRREAPV